MIAVLPHQADAAWFACLGLPLAAGDLRDAAAYLAALGYPPSTPVRGVPDWPAALALTRDPNWDRLFGIAALSRVRNPLYRPL